MFDGENSFSGLGEETLFVAIEDAGRVARGWQSVFPKEQFRNQSYESRRSFEYNSCKPK